MIEALLITLTGSRIITVPSPPPPDVKFIRPAPVRTVYTPHALPRPVRNDVLCRRVTRMWEYPPVYEEVS